MTDTELSTVLEQQFQTPTIADALPEHFNTARFVQNAIALVNDKPELANQPQAKLLPGLLKGAYLGLDFFSNEAYLIPYGSDLQFSISYKGMIKLCQRFSVRPIKNIYARIVREGDEFSDGIKDNKPMINFTPKPLNDGAIIGAFAVAEYEDGDIQYEVMNKSQLDAVKHLSKAQNGTAWGKFPEEMYKKSVIRRLCKNISLNLDTQAQKAYNDDSVIEVKEVSEVVNPF